jgi:WD40 repeat protein
MDINQIKPHRKFDHDGTFYSLCADCCGVRLFAGSSDYGVHVFDLADAKDDSKQPVARWAQHDNYVSALGFVETAGGGQVVSGSFDRHLIWWNPDTGEPLRQVEAHGGWLRDLVVFPDSSRLASVGDDMRLKIWDSATGELVHDLAGHAAQTPQGHVTALYEVAVTPDGKHLATADRHGEVRVWEADAGKSIQAFQVPILYTYDPRQRKRSIGGIRSLAFSPDGRHLAIGGIGQVGNVDGLAGRATVEIWDWQKPARLAQAEAEEHQGIVNHLAFHPKNGWLLGAGGGSDAGFLAIWETGSALLAGPSAERADATAGSPQADNAEKADPPSIALPVHRIKADGHVHQFLVSASGRELYAAGHGKLEIWDLGE